MTPCKIMIVEDEPVIAIDLQDRLERMGYTVVGSVDTGREAIDRVAEFGAELVLMDIRLRDKITGIEAAGTIQQERDIPVVFLTAHSDDATVLQARNVQPFGYLLKPCEDRELRVAVEMAIYRHEMETRLKRIERWQATTLKSIGDGVIATDVDGRVNFLNPVAEELLGLTLEQAFDRPFEDIFIVIHEPTRKPLPSIAKRAIKEGISIELEPDAVLLAHNGREFHIADSASPMRNERDKITGVVVVFRDVTPRVLAQKEKEQAQQQLLQIQKLELVGQLAGGIAHDFNNLMTVILGQCSILQMSEIAPAEFSRILAIEKAGERAAELTSQLLKFARRQVIHPQHVSLNTVLSDIQDILERLVGNNLTLSIERTAADTTILSDSSLLGQVILNLVVNARDAISVGGKITVKTARVDSSKLTEDLRRKLGTGDVIMLTVSDTGMGMDQEILSHLFEPFFTTKEIGKGTGLGLSVVHGIVSQSGGQIVVTSELGKGSTFSVYFPVNVPKLKSAPILRDVHERRDGKLSGKTILCVESSTELSEIYRDILAPTGCTLIVVATSKEAQEACKRLNAPLDLLVTDIGLNELDGVELSKTLFNDHPGMRTLYLSGYEGEQIYGAMLAENPNFDFLKKPARMDELITRILNLLSSPSKRIGRWTGSNADVKNM